MPFLLRVSMEYAIIALFALFLIVIPGIAAMPRIMSWVRTGGPDGSPAWTMVRFWLDVAVLLAIVAFLVWMTVMDGFFILEDAHAAWWAAPLAIVVIYLIARLMMPAATQEPKPGEEG